MVNPAKNKHLSNSTLSDAVWGGIIELIKLAETPDLSNFY